MTRPLFDSYLRVDLSSAGSPKTVKDSIWIAHAVRGTSTTQLENPPTRLSAMKRISAILEGELVVRRRVLAGFDFPFGYPEGTAERLAGRPGWEAIWEKLYSEPGFGIWMGNFSDILINEESNALITEFIGKKIREQVKDPAVAAKLVPAPELNYGTKRQPCETGYYEAYNRDNVTLIDLKADPIQEITPAGIRTKSAAASS